jgi:hypothetical protein
LETLLWLAAQFLWVLWAILTWLAVQIFWLAVWLLLPVIVLTAIAIRAAEYTLGKDPVRAWVKRQSLRFGTVTWHQARRALFALGALPVRVLGWLILLTFWHSVISLWWTPRWSPVRRAWGHRWRRHVPHQRLS